MGYEITVNRPTGKKFVEVAGLGVFENGKTTLLTDEQEQRWFNRTGANPLANFPEGIEVKEVGRRQAPPSQQAEDKPAENKSPAEDKKQQAPATAKPADGKGEAR